MRTRSLSLVLALGFALSAVGAQEVFTDYYGMQSYANLPIVRLGGVEDAAAFAKKSGAREAFIRWSVEDKTSSELLFEVKGTFYAVDLKGFRTVEDFRAGTKGGFPSGGDFYKAKAGGVTEYELYRYSVRNTFLSLADAKKAHAAGFVFDAPKADLVILPLQVPKSSLDDFLKTLPFLRVYLLGNPAPVAGTAPVATPPGPVAPTSGGTGASPGTPSAGAAAAARFEGAYRLESSVYKLADPAKRVLKAYPVAVARTTLSESQLYYLATANGLGKYEDYAALYEAFAAGFTSPKDLADAQGKGFKAGPAYYAALQGGFTSAEDYTQALDFGVATVAAYKPLKDFWDRTAKTAAAEQKPFGDAAMATVLTLLPRGKPYPLATIVEFAAKGILVNDRYRKLLSDKGFQNTETAYLAFFRKYPDLPSGTYAADAGVFTRN